MDLYVRSLNSEYILQNNGFPPYMLDNTQNIWQNLQGYCIACGKALFTFCRQAMTQTYLHYLVPWAEVNGSHEETGK